MTSSPRTRTITWEDPLQTAKAMHGVSGIEFLRAIAEGRLPQPPIGRTMGYRLAEVGEGWARFEIEPGEHLYNPIGMVHGGVASTLLDSAMACAIQSTLPAGTVYTTIELKINLIRAIQANSGKLIAEGRIINVGRKIGVADGTLKDSAGKLYAHGTTTCLILQN